MKSTGRRGPKGAKSKPAAGGGGADREKASGAPPDPGQAARVPRIVAEHPSSVVGIGASAGGLEAFTQLLGHLPRDTGMAFVLVQHLDPNRESMLQEILSRATRMPVREASSGMKIEANHVYLMPARAGIELVDGMFWLVPRGSAAGRGMPIDHFFFSLAERYRSRAIGVVLSGSLSDGALGLRAIKAEGGVTFAQDENSAKFRDMPRAAIAAGSVDFVCPPETIAKELARMGEHPLVRPSGEPPPADDEGTYRKILALLRKGLRVDFSTYRQSTIRRRIARRLVLKKVETLEQYLDLLRESPGELNALYEDILITVTEFFRDPEVFETLKTRVFPALLRGRASDSPVRIWVPGCSTGEEVYSLAITLFESVPEASVMPGVQIFATDISETAIERARAGVFLENHLVNLSPERRRRFFTKQDGGYQIAKIIRDSCIFARQDVTADPPFSNIDLISCRNLLIYLEQALQSRVLPLFHYALNPNGVLLLGSAEALGGFGNLFVPIDRAQRIFSKVPGSTRLPVRFERPAPDSPGRPEDSGPPTPSATPLTSWDLQKEADRIVLGRYAPAGVVVNDLFDVVQFRGRTGRFLEVPSGAASFNLLKMAREGLLSELRGAILKARRSGSRVRRENVRIVQDGALRRVNLEIVPLKDPGEHGRHYVVLFEDAKEMKAPTKRSPPETAASRRRRKTDEDAIIRLEGELTATKEYLQSIIEEQEAATEELKAANEEILSSNEELQSTNEELETSKEELESTNEELSTVNEELANRNAELATANNDLWNLSGGINVPVVMVDLEGRIRRFTPPAEALFNLIPTDVGRNVSDIKGRLKGIDLAGTIRDVLATITPKEKEVQDESGNWYQLRVRPYRTTENRIEGTTISLFDIDPLKRSLEQVNRARDYAEALVETVQEALIVLDEDLRVRTANHAFYRLFQSAPLATEGKLLFSIPDWAPQEDALRERLLDVLSQREAGMANFELDLDFAAVGRKILCLNARRVRLPGESNPFVVLAMEDITERREAERHLRQSEARYRTLFQTAREGIWILDGQSATILEVNEHLTRMLGHPTDALVGHKPWELDLYDDNEAARIRFRELRKRGASFDPQLRMKARSGSFLFVEAVSNVYQVDEARVVQCNMRDITDRMRLQEDLRQVQKLESIGRLAGGVAHDFNNILNIISAHAALLSRRKQEPARQEESLEAIQKAVLRGSAVVRQLLTFARRTDISSEQVDVNALVEEVAKMLEETFPKSIDIQLDLDPDLPAILADPNQIHQAVLNLCVNARDAMPEGGTLRMDTAITKGSELQARLPEALSSTYVSVSVSDNGTGMTEETRGRVFEPFFTTKAPGAGDGLGLAVVYGVVNSHSGLIELETFEGRGTRFQLHFPVGAPRTGATAAAREDAVSGGDGHETLLLIEDEESLLQAVRSLLESEGYLVLTARDGVEAVEIHRENAGKIAAVVADLGLPKLGGWEAFLKMKELEPALKCIVASGNLDSQKRLQMHREGVHASLRKPYGAAEVLKTVRKVLDSRR